VLLFDRASGAPLAVIDGAAVTALRTAAASGLATDRLARPDVRSLGVLGAGVQARAHLEAILAVRPAIAEVMVWARRPEAARAVAEEEAARLGVAIRAVSDPAEAGACDVVCTVTSAAAPVLKGDWLTPGGHINLVGAHRPFDREADTAALACARLFVDARASALAEAGDILIPISEGAFGPEHIVGEIGEVVAGYVTGRRDPLEITAYKSLGSVAQDLYAAGAILARAKASGDGIDVAF
jgi:ornithine cyclodeaminase